MKSQSESSLFPAELLIATSNAAAIQHDEQSLISVSSSWLNDLENSSKHPSINLSPIPFLINNVATPSIIHPSNTAIQPPLLPSPVYDYMNMNALNGFSFLSTTAAATHNNNNVNNNNNVHNQIINDKINAILNNSYNSDKDTESSKATGRSIAVTFLTMYYNALHANPMTLKRFYHLNAKIDRSDFIVNTDNDNTDNVFNKLSVLKNVLFVDIDEIIHQNSINNSILIRVNGTMKFLQSEEKQFEQIFFINKTNEGFWLIQNDIFWFIHNDVIDNDNDNDNDHIDLKKQNQENQERFTNLNSLNIGINTINDHQNQNEELLSYSTVTAKSRNTTTNINKQQQSINIDKNHRDNQNVKDINNNNTNMVNKRMVNKFYHDPSYQKYDNNLAIFIRGIPNNITHSKLCGILRTNLLKQLNITRNKNNQSVDILIDYIDVNYHKQFAFVYFGNEDTLNIALKMDKFYINGTLCQIQRKRSHNGPRKFLPKKQNN